METVISKLREDLWKYVQGSTESLIIFEILMGILILQYTFKMEPISILEIITSVISGLYVADLISGLIHIYVDTDNTYTFSNLEHHNTPYNIIHESNFTNLQHTSVVPFPLTCIFFNLMLSTTKSQILFQIVSLYVARANTIIHKFSHLTNYLTDDDKQKPEYKLMMFLQDYQLILHPRDHHLHHISPYDVNFCVVNGWANLLLNSIVHIPFIHSRLFPKIHT